jgi:hypothetical protein
MDIIYDRERTQTNCSLDHASNMYGWLEFTNKYETQMLLMENAEKKGRHHCGSDPTY